ncbi:MAG: hypothetical protein ACO1RX_08410 [Candidatus Sericytochromatia bacterium]
MALRIATARPCASEQTRQQRLAAFVAEDPFLQPYFREQHPLFLWEPLQLSESLSYRVSLRHDPAQSVIGCAELFDLQGEQPDRHQTQQFTSAYTSVLRTLLFCQNNPDVAKRQALELLDAQGQIQWDTVLLFAHLATRHLPIHVKTRDDPTRLSLIFEPQAPLQALPVGLHLQRASLQSRCQETLHAEGLTPAQEALQDQLLIQICRCLLSLVSPAQAVAMQTTQAGPLSPSASLRDPDFQQQQAAREERIQRLSAQLLERIDALTGHEPGL